MKKWFSKIAANITKIFGRKDVEDGEKTSQSTSQSVTNAKSTKTLSQPTGSPSRPRTQVKINLETAYDYDLPFLSLRSEANLLTGAIRVERVIERYESKGVTGPGKLVMVLSDELQFLFTEAFIIEMHDEVNVHVRDGTEDLRIALELSTSRRGLDAVTYQTFSRSVTRNGNVDYQNHQNQIAVAYEDFIDSGTSHIYLTRYWTSYRSIMSTSGSIPKYLMVNGGLPVSRRENHINGANSWMVVMYLGIEKTVDGKIKWAKWLVGEKVYCGWFHPDAMREFAPDVVE